MCGIFFHPQDMCNHCNLGTDRSMTRTKFQLNHSQQQTQGGVPLGTLGVLRDLKQLDCGVIVITFQAVVGADFYN